MAGKEKLHPGEKYGYLTIIEDSGKRNSDGNIIWKCRCECGNIIMRRSDMIMQSVREHRVISCGCKRDKSIGKREAFNKDRIDKARTSLGQVEGTTMRGIERLKLNKNNKSGVRGVYYSSRYNKWCANITIRRKSIKAYFDKFEDAVKYRQYLEEVYFDPVKEQYEKEHGKYRKENRE